MAKIINNHLRNGYSNYNLLFLKKYIKELDKSSRILDIGCGHFRNLYLFYKIGFRNLYGIDKLLPEPSIKKEECFYVEFIQQDILKGLPYDSMAYDVVLCNFVLMFIQESRKTSVIDDILRVTKKFCIIETQHRYYKSKYTSVHSYNFLDIANYISKRPDFEIIDLKRSREKLIARRVCNG